VRVSGGRERAVDSPFFTWVAVMASYLGVGRDLHYLVHPDVMVQIRRDFEKAGARKGSATLSRHEFVTAMLKYVPTESSGVAVGTVDGEVGSKVPFAKDFVAGEAGLESADQRTCLPLRGFVPVWNYPFILAIRSGYRQESVRAV
jgi:hypothetical protein